MGDLAYAALVTGVIARGKVATLELESARRTKGVLSYGDFEGVSPPSFRVGGASSLAPLQQQEIVHDGQIIALVVADTFEAACDGAERVIAGYASHYDIQFLRGAECR